MPPVVGYGYFLESPNTSIRGISLDRQETKLLQYADDTTATLSDLNSARAFFDLLDTFKLLSGLAIN